MERRLAILGIAAMVLILGLSAWYDLSGRRHEAAPTQPTVTPTARPTSPATSTHQPDQSLVQRNRDERTGPSWSPRDVNGPDGKPLAFGHIVPGAIEPLRAGESIGEAVKTGFLVPDPARGKSCEGGPFWKFKDQLSGGLDVIVGRDKKITSLGLFKSGAIETAEGISVGNSYGALKKTYGARLQGPVRMDYGQAGAFLRDGQDWIGFSMDNRPGRLADTSHIAFIEVTHGTRPGLLRDGC